MYHYEVGTKVLAMRNTDEGKLYVIGTGIYLGELVPDEEVFKVTGIANPCIKLDDGGYVWGYQCWWGPEDRVREHFANYEFIQIEPEEVAKFTGVSPVEEATT